MSSTNTTTPWDTIITLPDVILIQRLGTAFAPLLPPLKKSLGCVYFWVEQGSSRPWAPLADWNDTMTLAWHCGIEIKQIEREDPEDADIFQCAVALPDNTQRQRLLSATEADCRRDICRLALWWAEEQTR